MIENLLKSKGLREFAIIGIIVNATLLAAFFSAGPWVQANPAASLVSMLFFVIGVGASLVAFMIGREIDDRLDKLDKEAAELDSAPPETLNSLRKNLSNMRSRLQEYSRFGNFGLVCPAIGLVNYFIVVVNGPFLELELAFPPQF